MSKKMKGPWAVGKKMFIRTVTMHLTGEIASVYKREIVLKKAAWIADSGRLGEFLLDPSTYADEVEMFSADVIIGRASIVDATEIDNLPTDTK